MTKNKLGKPNAHFLGKVVETSNGGLKIKRTKLDVKKRSIKREMPCLQLTA